jgi:tRNA pseudouridine38-40 synthase
VVTEPIEPTVTTGALVRLRLDLGYDGTDFSGWARQPGRRTVQETVEAGLMPLLRLPEQPKLTCAGRTDAGVHARGQVCHVDVPLASFRAVVGRSDQPPEIVLRDRLAGVLPPDVRVRTVSVAPDGFDARFAAIWRRYAYRICDTPAAADPLRRREVLYHPRALDVEAMTAAAQAMVGEHDYAAFCRRREGATTVRTLRELTWQRDETGLAVARVVADAFCHSMVRSLMGALVAVGEHRFGPGWAQSVLETAEREARVRVMPAHGLVLEEVVYPPDEALADRAAQARRLREH